MEAIIELKDIKKAYGQTEVLNHFNLSIDQGEFITIIGTSGSGKTTVLKMINGLIQPTSGHVKVHGQDIQEQDLIQLRRHMGYVIQGSVLFPHLTVKQNIAYVLQLEKKTKNNDTERCNEKMNKVEQRSARLCLENHFYNLSDLT